jgi:DNA mismatch endonuclease, patch repair protein
MGRVRGRDTAPELAVRRELHRRGFRFRLHRQDLPGKPDIVLPKYKTVVLVHGCFWHGHAGCSRSRRPTTNIAFWDRKLDGNISRDAAVRKELEDSGWRVIVVWQCRIRTSADVVCFVKNLFSGWSG